jgi:hypothetical protein
MILATQINFGQNNLSPTGDVGIGTTNPVSKLTVNGSLTINGGLSNTLARPFIASGTLVNGEIRGYSNAGTGADDGFLRLSAGGGSSKIVKSYIDLTGYSTIPDMYSNIVFGTGGVERMRIDINGNIGIGIAAPKGKLDLAGQVISYNAAFGQTDVLTSTKNYANFGTNNHGSVLMSSNLYFSDNDFLKVANTHPTMSGGAILIPGNYQQNQGSILFYTNESGSVLADQNYTGAVSMTIRGNGNVGIGTINPDAKLAVNGTIHSKEVKVDVNIPVPDYVFAEDYKLKTLKEVEDYVKENSHLPEIPSAKEIDKNGLMLAEMNMALLKKIEELTLYAIEQEKKTETIMKYVQTQDKYIVDLNKSLLNQSERLKKLENKINL